MAAVGVAGVRGVRCDAMEDSELLRREQAQEFFQQNADYVATNACASGATLSPLSQYFCSRALKGAREDLIRLKETFLARR